MSEQLQTSSQPPTSSQLASVMKANVANAPRVLRLGLVRDGRVVEDRVLKSRQAVTVGETEGNTFVLPATGLPPDFKLFEVEGNDYVLQFTARMNGRVVLGDELIELGQLRERCERRGECYRFTLAEGMRGKVVVGNNALLFQFVEPPPPQPRPQLPASVTRGAVGIDWPTTLIAAFSFLVHFMAIGALYSDWLDPVVDYDVNLSNLVETFKSLPPPPEVEEKNVDEKPEEKKAEEEKAPEKKPVAKEQPKDPAQKQPMSRAEVAALAEQLDSFDMGILGANIGKTATSDVLSSSDNISTSIMDQAAASGAGVSAGGPGGLKLTRAGGALDPGATGASLSSIGSAGKTGGGGSGVAAAVKGPTGTATLGGATVAVGQVSDASRVVARMRPGFRQCYQKGLEANPDSSGRISLKIRIGPGGEVTGVTASASGSLPSSVVECIKARAQGVRFSPPDGGSAVIEVPVTFVAQ